MLLIERSQVQQLKREFDHLFGIVPLVAFGLLFITIPGSVVSLTVVSRNQPHTATLQVVSNILYHGLIVSAVLVLTIAAEYSRHRINRATDAAVTHLQLRVCTSREERETANALERELRRQQKHRLSGCRFFSISQSLLLSFAAAVVNVSVFLIQVATTPMSVGESSGAPALAGNRSASLVRTSN